MREVYTILPVPDRLTPGGYLTYVVRRTPLSIYLSVVINLSPGVLVRGEHPSEIVPQFRKYGV